MKMLGVIGGLGPMATALFMKMVTEMTDAETDQEHIESIIYNCPKIPDRTGYILGRSLDNPAEEMLRVGRKLVDQGAEWIAIPCITAGCFYEELSEGLKGAGLINIMEDAGKYLKERGITRAGLLATSGTVQSGHLQRALAAYGCELILPSPGGQADIMHVIYDNVKANKPVERERIVTVSAQLRGQGAQVVLLGCTELSVAEAQCPLGPGYLDLMRLLARSAVERCGRLRREYAELITGRGKQG